MTIQEYRTSQLNFIDVLIQRYGTNNRLDVTSSELLSDNENPEECTLDLVNGVFVYNCMMRDLHRTNTGLLLEVYDTWHKTLLMLPLVELCSFNLDMIIHRITR